LRLLPERRTPIRQGWQEIACSCRFGERRFDFRDAAWGQYQTRKDASQQAGIANSAWTVQASVAMVGHVLSETAVRVSIASVVIFRKKNYEQGI
jgi:hypothetical protein